MTEREQKIGLTFTQILSLIGMCGLIMAAWINLNVKIAENSAKIEALEKGRIDNATSIKQIFNDNRDDHKVIMEKLDQLIYDFMVK